MSKNHSVILALLLSGLVLLTGCETLGTASDNSQTSAPGGSGIDKTVAQIGGGLLGGLVGNQFGDGTGNTLMTIAGAIGGAYLGGELVGDSNTQSTPGIQTAAGSTGAETVRTQADSALNKYCHKRIKYHKDVPVQVDVAYIRYKRNFGYMTKDEHNRAQGLNPEMTNKFYLQMDRGFRHIKEPGVHYHMKEEVDLDTGHNIGWLSLELENAGYNKTRVFVNYCEGGENGFDPQYSKVIRKKVDKGYL